MRSIRFISFGDFGTKDRTRFTAHGRLSPTSDWRVSPPAGLAAPADSRRCNSCGSVNSHAAEAAATAIATKTSPSDNRIEGSTSVLDAHQARDDEGSDQLEGAGDEQQVDAPWIFPEHLHEVRRQDEQDARKRRRHA